MACINFQIQELIDVLKRSDKIAEEVKAIDLQGERIRVLVSPAKLCPNIEIFLQYKSFSNGKMYFDVQFTGPVKLLLKLFKGSDFDLFDEVWQYDQNNLMIDVNKYLNQNFDFINVKNVTKRGNEFSIIF